jgi:hypothetical protein
VKPSTPVLAAILCLALLSVGWGVRLAGRGEASRPPLGQAAYVWQRNWTAAVAEGVRKADPGLSKLVFLSAQVDWDRDRAIVIRVRPGYEALCSSGRRVGLALRITVAQTPLVPGGSAVAELAALASNLVAEANGSGLQPVEFQIDYDCPESRLREFSGWLPVLKRAVLPCALTITVLPCWLSHPDCRQLLDVADGFVLQVHSLSMQSGKREPRLLDSRDARCAVWRAARFGRPFEVALPTYGYLVARDGSGKWLGVAAEQLMTRRPPDCTLEEVRSDPVQVAELVREWLSDSPATMTGLIWYRLPVDGDRLNWTSPTLACVMKGVTPQPALTVENLQRDDCLCDIQVGNRGTADGVLSGVVIHIPCGSNDVEAADALGGWSLTRGPGSLWLAAPVRELPQRLKPGESKTAGWVRWRHPTAPRQLALTKGGSVP